MKLKISIDLSLPIDTVTQTMAVLAKRRAGKSYTMRRIAEQLFLAHQQIVIVDPKGDQWGIRSASNGNGPGLPVIILGGERGDVPLEPSGGEIVAKLVVEERVSVLLDLSLFRKHEVATFMTGFMESLYRLKAHEIYRTPMMLIIDEADAIAPQKPQKGEERMLGAAEDIVRRGGQRGIGCVLVTQRSAVLNKNVLTQAQILVALRTIAPQDLAAMDAWIQVHGEPAQRKQLMESLPSLPVGDAWFWSPGWPDTDGIFKRVHVLPIKTFDSGATPKPGERKVEPKHAADVDLNALKKQMAATIERAKADNPRELRKENAQLKRELDAAKQQKPPSQAPTKIERIDVPVVGKRAISGIKQAASDMRKAALKISAVHASWLKPMNEIAVRLDKLCALVEKTTKTAPETPPRKLPSVAELNSEWNKSIPKNPQNLKLGNGETMLPQGERKILRAAAQNEPQGATRTQLTILAGYKRSTRDAYIFRLREKGFVEIEGEYVRATQDGIDALGTDFHPLPTGRALLSHWMGKLPEGERKILEHVSDAHPSAVSRDALSTATGYARSSRDAYIQRLKSRKIVTIVSGGDVKASAELFD